MFAKLLAIILTLGVVGCVLLVNRQQRIEASYTLTNLHKRVAEHDRALWKLRTEISELASPERLRQVPQHLPGEWVPVAVEMERQRREREAAYAQNTDLSNAPGPRTP